MRKKKNIKEMNQLNGKLPEATPCLTLDDVIGIRQTSRYAQKTVEEYKQYLDSMNSTDLQRHAQSLGIRPSHEVFHLKRGLIAEFERYFKQHLVRAYSVPTQHGEVSSEVKEILNRGR